DGRLPAYRKPEKGQKPPAPEPPATLDVKKLDRIEEEVNTAIEKGQLPGAVGLVLHRDRVVYRKALGSRSLGPEKGSVPADPVFDLASLTKPVATSTSVMLLLERDKLALSDKVSKHWPEFAANGKDGITVENLLLHTSGLIADNALDDYKDGEAKALE